MSVKHRFVEIGMWSRMAAKRSEASRLHDASVYDESSTPTIFVSAQSSTGGLYALDVLSIFIAESSTRSMIPRNRKAWSSRVHTYQRSETINSSFSKRTNFKFAYRIWHPLSPCSIDRLFQRFVLPNCVHLWRWLAHSCHSLWGNSWIQS